MLLVQGRYIGRSQPYIFNFPLLGDITWGFIHNKVYTISIHRNTYGYNWCIFIWNKAGTHRYAWVPYDSCPINKYWIINSNIVDSNDLALAV